MQLRRATGDGPIRLQPSTWHDLLAELQRLRQGLDAITAKLGGNRGPLPAGVVWVQHDSEGVIHLGKPVGIGAPIVSFEENEDAYKSMPLNQGIIFSYETPDADTHYDRVAIAIEPIPSGAAGRCCLSGACLAWVDITDNSHEYAIADDGGDHLQSALGGTVQRLWPAPDPNYDPTDEEEDDPLGETLCIVRIGNLVDPPDMYGVLDGALLAGDSATVSIHVDGEDTGRNQEAFDNVMAAGEQLPAETLVHIRWNRAERRYYAYLASDCPEEAPEE